MCLPFFGRGLLQDLELGATVSELALEVLGDARHLVRALCALRCFVSEAHTRVRRDLDK